MSRFSLLITSIIYYFPVIGLWRFLLEQRFGFNIPLFGFRFGVNIPNSGIILLFFFSLITWAVIWALLFGIEKILKIDLLEKLKLRNGMLYAERPRFTIGVLDVLAYICFGFLVVKYVFLSILQMILSTGLLAGLGKLIPIAGQNIGLTFGRVIESFLSKPLEMAALSLSLLVIIVSIVEKLEKRARFYSDIENSQEKRHQGQKKIIIPRIQIR